MPVISFSHPWYLLLLPLLIAGAVYVSRESLADLRGGRARWSLGLRIAIVTLAVLALAGLQIRRPAKELAVLFVLDQSDSIPTEQKREQINFVNQAARKMGPNDEGGVLVFGSDAYMELEPKPVLNLKQIHSLPKKDYTNLAGAIRLALSAFPDDTQRRVVLLSDGNENLGSAVQEAATAASAQVELDVVPVTYEYKREVMLEKMVVPSEAKVGEPFDVRIIARATEKTPAVIRLLRDGELIARQGVNLLPGPNAIVFHQGIEEAKFHTYEAVIESKDDTLAENNTAMGFTLVKGKPRVLIVDSNPQDSRFLAAALQGQKLEVDVRAPGQLPATLAEFQTYDSIVLSNVGAYQLTPDQMKAIQSSVRDLGAGLVMVGGENSYGPGAYRGTPIEAALPVDMEVKKHKVMPVGAVAMVLHTCEFPDGNRWARETAASVVDVLGERDKVGVLLYGMGGEEWGIPIQPAANKEKIKSELYNLDPGDMPDFHQIIKMAYEGLQTDAKEAAVKHIIVISDGDPSPPSPQLLADIRKAKITMSTVAVFPHGGGTGTLENMAQVGKGQFYNVRNPAEIPRIFLKEAQRVLKPAIIEETFTPNVLKDSQILSGINSTPPLMGYVATSPKDAPSVEVAMSSKHDDPILASWRYGLGKAVAFMSDAKNRWAAPWLANPGMFTRFWAQTIRWTVRTTSRGNLDSQVDISQRKGRVVVDVVNSKGEFVNGLDIRGSVAGPDVSPGLHIDQTAPGRYEGEFDAPEKGQYMVALRFKDETGTPRLHTIGAAVPYSPEYRALSENMAVLTGVAEKTGGRIYGRLGPQTRDADLAPLWRHDRKAHSAPEELWQLLILTAALLLPADIAVRRLMVSRSEWAAMAAAVYEHTLGRIGQHTAAEKVESTNRLLGAKARAAGRMGTDAEAAVAAQQAEAIAEEAAVPEAAPEPQRPRYEGPARRMPTVQGAQGVTPAPTAGPSRRTDAERPELEMAAPEASASTPAPPAAARPVEPTAPPPAGQPSSPQPEPPKPAAPPPPAEKPAVTWHRPVPGVTPTAGGTPPPASRSANPPAAEKPSDPAQPAREGADESTSRLLRAKRRARDPQDPQDPQGPQ